MHYRSKTLHRWIALAGMLAALGTQFSGTLAAAPADGNPEDFKFEITGSAWLVNSSGTIQSHGTPVDLVSDLGAEQQQPSFFGQLVFKPGRRHRIVVNGYPVRLTGLNTVNRTITYQGQTFNVSDTVSSSADVNYVFAGYQYDVLTGPAGHLGFSVGGAYLDASGSIHSQTANTTASKSETFGMPLAGVDARLFPIPGHKLIEIEGGLRGMGLGDYGHYLEGSVQGGVALGPVTFLAGYRRVNADIHSNSGTNPSGVDVNLSGPIFSVMFRH
jgi:hypothetical protein